MKIEKIKISETTYGEVQKIKTNNNMAQDEDVINLLLQYYNDPMFHLSQDFKFELMKLMDKQKEENKVENIEQMIQAMRETIEEYQSK